MKRFGLLILIGWAPVFFGYADPVSANVVINSLSPTIGWAGTNTTNGTLVKIKGTGFDVAPGGNEVQFTDTVNAQTVKAKVEWTVSDGNAYAFSKYIGKPGTGGGGLNKPWDIAVDTVGGTIYVVNKLHTRIEVFNSSGVFVRMIGKGSLTDPWGVGVDPKGNVYVSDQVNASSGRIVVFSKSGTQVKVIGSGDLKRPRDLVVDKSGAVYVIENKNRFVKFLANGQKIFSLEGPLHRKFDHLVGIALDPFGYPGSSIYLADQSTRSVYRYNHFGIYLGHRSVGDYPLPSYVVPKGIAVDDFGTVIVQVGDGLYAKLDTDLKWLGDIEIKTGPVNNAHMRAVDASKRLYAVDDIHHTVKVFSPTDIGEIWVRVPKGAKTGPLQVKNQGGTATTGTFTVHEATGAISVDPAALSQGLSTYPFVIGKETLVYARIKGLYGQPGRDTATVEISGPDIFNPKPVAFDHFDFDPIKKVTTGHFHVPEGRIHKAGDFTFRVVIARDGKTYHKEDLLKTYSGTKPNGLIFARMSNVPNDQWNTKDPFPWFDMGAFLQMIANYRRTYPLHSGQIHYRFAGDQYAPELADNMADVKDRDELLWKAKLTLNQFNEPNFPGVRRVVALLDHKVQREWQGLGGVAPFNNDRALIFGLNGAGLVHEVGHSYGLVSTKWPNYDGLGKHHSKHHNFANEDGAPLTVWNSREDKLYSGSGSGYVATIMNPGGGGTYGLFECKYKNKKVDYWHLFNRFKNTSNPVTYSATPSDLGSSHAQVRQFAVTGIVDVAGNVTNIHSYLFTGKIAPISAANGDYALVFRNGFGSILASHAFSPVFDQGDGGVSDRGMFSLVRPFPPKTASVEIRRKKTVLKNMKPSRNPPTIEDVSVTVAENKRPVIRWAAGDRDGDPLTYTLYYAPNADTVFQPIISGVSGTSYIWDTALVGGSPEAVVKVVATDGFHTGSGVSAPVSLPKKLPHVAIIHPNGPTTVLEGRRVFVRGMAYDPEDGVVNGERLTWLINDRHPMGSGEYLDANITPVVLSANIQRQPLPPGVHTIRLTATDSDGNTASDTVTVRVEADADRDGFSDALEIACGSDPADPLSGCPAQSYVVKFVCGKGQGQLAVPGLYLTAINVRNPEHMPVTVKWRVSTAGKPATAEAVPTDLTINPNETVDIGCRRMTAGRDGGLQTGFVIIESPVPLNVVAVYTVSGADGQAESIHTERVMSEKTRPCPDLVVENIEHPKWEKDKGRSLIRARITNSGNMVSPPVTSRLVDRAPAEKSGNPQAAVASIPQLAPGASHTATFYLPYWVYNRTVHLEVTVDDAGKVPECRENNNVKTFRDKG